MVDDKVNNNPTNKSGKVTENSSPQGRTLSSPLPSPLLTMRYIHVKNLEKYHPGYKDRTLQWAKIYFKMAQGDPDCEMIDNETDWGRLIKLILLELQAQKPIPLNNDYLWKKGFNLKKRPILLTLKMLHNFISIVEMSTDTRHVDKDKEEDKEEDKDTSLFTEEHFKEIWLKYPNKDGSKKSLTYFLSSVKTDQDWKDINIALSNYLATEKVKKGFIKNGSTWFNNWKDWVEYKGKTGGFQAP